MLTSKVSIPIDSTQSISAVVLSTDHKSSKDRWGIILAHGAANDMNHPLLVAIAEGFCLSGAETMRFNFLYREKGRKSADSQKVLIQTWSSAFWFFVKNSGISAENIVVVGKSMGGRVASQMVADNLLPVKRLIFLGYPLHAPGKKEHLRDAHLYQIKLPMLFFSGTRDPFCDLFLLKDVLNKIGATAQLEIIDDGDHSLNLKKKSAITQADVYERVLARSMAWLKDEGA
jgi:predicted alpha/beta-hydrolase family hydrolase